MTRALERCQSEASASLESSYIDLRVCATLTLSRGALERDAAEEALQLADEALSHEHIATEFSQEAYALGIEAAMMTGDDDAIARLIAVVDAMPPAAARKLMHAGRARLAAEQALRRRDELAAERFEDEAIALLRSMGARPLLARTLLERAGRHEDPRARDEGRQILTELGATRWLATFDDPGGVTAQTAGT